MKDQLDSISKLSCLVQRRSEGHTQAVISDLRSSLQNLRVPAATREAHDQIQDQQYMALYTERCMPNFHILGKRMLNSLNLAAQAYLHERPELQKETLVTSKASPDSSFMILTRILEMISTKTRAGGLVKDPSDMRKRPKQSTQVVCFYRSLVCHYLCLHIHIVGRFS